jgi:Holliday junction resolvase RusA-like endonuclease
LTTNGVITFWVPGVPKAQPRPRAFARFIGGKPTARVYDAGTAEGWKGCIAIAAQRHAPASPLRGPLFIDIDFVFPRPKSLMRRKDPDGEFWHTAKPDRDNCDKAVLDALKTLGFFVDDAQVCGGEVRKLWVSKTGSPGARVRIHAFAEDITPAPAGAARGA